MKALQRAFCEAGYDPERFGELVPRLFVLLMTRAAKERKRAQERDITSAWLMACWSRAEKLPPLHEVLDTLTPRDPEEVAAERRAQLRALRKTLPQRTWAQWQQQS